MEILGYQTWEIPISVCVSAPAPVKIDFLICLAVCVCKHADIISPTPLQYGHLCKLVVFKLMKVRSFQSGVRSATFFFFFFKGKVKSMTECKEAGSQIDPTPNFDTHISKSTQFDISSVSHTEAFESSQVLKISSR